MQITTVGFDADDTLWHNETFFRLTQAHVLGLLADHAEREHLEQRLLEAERRNVGHYGYGVKGFTLSLIETAIEVTEGRVPASVIAEIMAAGRDLLAHPLELLPHAREVVEALADSHRIVLITKGDLLHQERKLAQSGLGDLFHVHHASANRFSMAASKARVCSAASASGSASGSSVGGGAGGSDCAILLSRT